MVPFRKKPLTLQSPYGAVELRREEHGIPVITAQQKPALYYGLGWVHACDRLINMEINRLVARGRGAEGLNPALLKLDIVMRRYDLWGDSVKEARKLQGTEKELIEAYCAGVNARLKDAPPPFEFRLIGHTPAPWTAADVIAALKLIGMIDLTESQGWMEKFIIEMLKQGYPIAMLREIFPYLTDEPDDETLAAIRRVRMPEPMVPETIAWAGLPRTQCSNNWVVSGAKSRSGKPLFCGDPHLDGSRLPAIWQEVILSCGEFRFAGAGVPGIPGFSMGRTDCLAWSPTYGNMDVVDYFMEDVRGGKYLRGGALRDFHVREETFGVRGGEAITVRFHETEHGVLEEEPSVDGCYLCLAWSGARGCGAESIAGMLEAPFCQSAQEALECFRKLDFAAFNWVVADASDNIGYWMSGRNPIRAKNCSGLLPLPGWDEHYDWQGYYDSAANPHLYNPAEHYIVTANQDMNALGGAPATNLAMAPYRARRIREMLEAREDHSVESMCGMHYDIYSKQAEDFMRVIKPFLPDTENGRILAQWDLRYTSDSAAPYLFERVYGELITSVFGDLHFGREVLDYLVHETILMHDYYYNFDRVLLSGDSAWFRGHGRDELFRAAIARALDTKPRPFGADRKIMMRNIFFSGRLPRLLGFDYGPIELIGGRTTISLSQIFKAGGRTATFSPTYRFITDFSETCIHSAMAGGPSDRRFSGLYTSGIKGWLEGRYNELRLPDRK